MMRVQITCKNCESSVEVYPDLEASKVQCDVCQTVSEVKFNQDHMNSKLEDCPICERKDFYSQKDFSRKIGVTLFIIAAIASIWTYGISFIVLYLFDFFLFKRIASVAICYNCSTNFRDISNLKDIRPFDHEMHDRIVYAGHNFEGKPINH